MDFPHPDILEEADTEIGIIGDDNKLSGDKKAHLIAAAGDV